MEIYAWISFVLASLVVLIIPGPTVILMMAICLAQGKRFAFIGTVGVAIGDFVAMTVAMVGLGAILLSSSEVYVILKIIGAIYLVYLGFKIVTSRQGLESFSEDEFLTPIQAIRKTALVTVLNPKSLVFFVSFVPQFLDNTAPLLPQASVMITTFVLLGSVNAFLFGYSTSTLAEYLQNPVWLRRMKIVCGSILMVFGTALLLR